MKGPYVDEYTAGVDLGLSPTMTVQFNYVRKYDGQGNKRVNLALPYSAYSVAVTRNDVGRDNVAGTADDRPLVLYAVPSTLSGQTIERFIQMNGDESKNQYDALGITFNKQYSNNWSFLTSFDASYRDLRNIEPRNPNEELYGPSDFDDVRAGQGGYRLRQPEWSYAGRISGSYQFPWGLLYASSFTAQSGEWFGRDVQVRDANNTNVTIRVEPQAGRYDWVKL